MTDLVRGLQRGEPGAWDEAWAAWRVRILGFLLRMCRDRAVAEELCQDTFLALAQHGPRLRDDTDLGAWLYTVARNRYRSWRRWAWLDARRLVALAQRPALPGPDPHQHAVGGETLRRLEAAIAGLPEGQREVFLLVAVDQLDQAAAAVVLGISPETLRQRLSRARAAIGRALETP